ncbi:Subtilisin-like protease SBT1.8 [Camellia lanceoleosa]|uniref:Subtilisin-like protease SBT1.8 n=1 Tax=Camellia lanceoleosa TaxID=1840588 RepID=A0ACC0F5S5_9ERIC|nr:Subtilisin-like protease SBT1.8 [Camellia lanceoleosa]
MNSTKERSATSSPNLWPKNLLLHYHLHHDWYSAHLQSLSSDSDSLLYTYTTAYHGFAASLDPYQADLLRHSDSVLRVYEDTVYTLHTTRIPEFLGLDTPDGFMG